MISFVVLLPCVLYPLGYILSRCILGFPVPVYGSMSTRRPGLSLEVRSDVVLSLEVSFQKFFYRKYFYELHKITRSFKCVDSTPFKPNLIMFLIIRLHTSLNIEVSFNLTLFISLIRYTDQHLS